MANKHDYNGPVPSNMQPQRGGTPRNVGSPPPDVPLESFSRPPQTQSAPTAAEPQRPAGSWAPQPSTRPHEAVKQGMGPDARPGGGGRTPTTQETRNMAKDRMNGPEKPSGTVVPERRSAGNAGNGDCDDAMKGGGSPMGGVPGSVGFSPDVPADAFSLRPSPTPGYRQPGHPERK
jgi:hypothetical protein